MEEPPEFSICKQRPFAKYEIIISKLPAPLWLVHAHIQKLIIQTIVANGRMMIFFWSTFSHIVGAQWNLTFPCSYGIGKQKSERSVTVYRKRTKRYLPIVCCTYIVGLRSDAAFIWIFDYFSYIPSWSF